MTLGAFGTTFTPSLLAKGFDKVFWTEADSIESYIDKLYNVETKKQYQIKMQSMAGVPDAASWDANGETIPLQVVNPRFSISLTNAYYANGIAYTKAQKDFNQYGIMNDATGAFAKSFKRKQASLAASFFTGGFTTVWNPDENVYFFSANHTFDPRYSTS
jgi:hypothetical protein